MTPQFWSSSSSPHKQLMVDNPGLRIGRSDRDAGKTTNSSYDEFDRSLCHTRDAMELWVMAATALLVASGFKAWSSCLLIALKRRSQKGIRDYLSCVRCKKIVD